MTAILSSVVAAVREHWVALAVGAASVGGLYLLSLPRPYFDFNKICGQFDPNNLAVDPYFFDNSRFAWAAEVESQWEVIRDELLLFLQRKQLVPYFGSNLMSAPQVWKVLGLKFWGLNHSENQAHFPKTMAILNRVPGLSLVAFSQLDPESEIKPHNGDTNANIRCHLGLVVPGPLPELGFRVGTEVRSWEEGKVRPGKRKWAGNIKAIRFKEAKHVPRSDCVAPYRALVSGACAPSVLETRTL